MGVERQARAGWEAEVLPLHLLASVYCESQPVLPAVKDEETTGRGADELHFVGVEVDLGQVGG